MYYVQPDIMNFPTQNKELSQEFNFAVEMFKFFPKTVNLAFEGKRLASADETNTHQMGGWTVSDDWYQALNEYSIPGELAHTIATDEHYNRNMSDDMSDKQTQWQQKIENGQIANNTDVFNNVSLTGWGDNNTWGFNGGDWVSGFVHFSNGLTKEYFWGENVAASIDNVDYDAQGNEWNHLEQRKSLGLAAIGQKNVTMPKDTALDADVEKSYFIGDFLTSIGSNWDELQLVLDKLSGQSYYEMVMNGVEPDRRGSSYLALTDREKTLLIASMVESRNRVYSICEKVMGPVAATWSDQQMIANINSWLKSHSSQALSHGINAFRILMENSHLMLNQIYQFSKTTSYNDAGYSSSMLDRYAFWQFNKDSGAEYFNKYNPDNDSYHIEHDDYWDQWGRPGSDSRGAIFNFINTQFPGSVDNSAIRDYLMKPLSSFSLDSKVSDMPDPPAGAASGLKAMKWLIEQWFGASNRVQPGYNNVPKPESLKPYVEYGDGANGGNQFSTARPAGYSSGYTTQNIGGRTVMVPNTVSNQGTAGESYGWDRVGGPVDDRSEDNFYTTDSDNNSISSSDDKTRGTWTDIYNTLRTEYGLSYVSPRAINGDCHAFYVRKQFSGLNTDEIMGRGGFIAPFVNSWAVNFDGKFTLHGKNTDKMRMDIFNFMDQTETQHYKRADRKYREDKEQNQNDEADAEKYSAKVAGAAKNERKRSEQTVQATAQKRRQEAQSSAAKPHSAKKPKKS
jgi:hypothetical protein